MFNIAVEDDLGQLTDLYRDKSKHVTIYEKWHVPCHNAELTRENIDVEI
jgi:hypothetical protein